MSESFPHLTTFQITATGDNIFEEPVGKAAMEKLLHIWWRRIADKRGFVFDPDQKLRISSSWRGAVAYYWATGYVLRETEQE